MLLNPKYWPLNAIERCFFWDTLYVLCIPNYWLTFKNSKVKVNPLYFLGTNKQTWGSPGEHYQRMVLRVWVIVSGPVGHPQSIEEVHKANPNFMGLSLSNASLVFLFFPTLWESEMKALRTLLHLQNHYCQQKSIADLEVVTSIHLFIFRHFAIQLRGEKLLLLYFFSPNFLSIKVLINILKFPDYVSSSPLLFIMDPSSTSVNTRGNCLAR